MNTQNKTTETVKREPEYTLEDCGCYVDGARGIYAIDAIVEIAESHGAKIADCDPEDKHEHVSTSDTSRFAGCEFAGDIEDECDTYMNDNYGVPGAYWGRNENGDWGLWTTEE